MNSTRQLLISFDKGEMINSTESSSINSTQLEDDSNVNTAAVYTAKDFAAMAIVFVAVLVLSVLWQKRYPPFCMFQKKRLSEDKTFEDTEGNLSPDFNGINELELLNM